MTELRAALERIAAINRGPKELLGGAEACPSARVESYEIARAALTAAPVEREQFAWRLVGVRRLQRGQG